MRNFGPFGYRPSDSLHRQIHQKDRELQASVKEYVGTFVLGATTPSYDLETEIDNTYSTEGITEEKVREALKSFEGEQEQIPPLFSAKMVDGQRAYIAARKGKNVEMQINHGRKKIKTYSGVIEDAYHSVFVVKLNNALANGKVSYSYSDILCGDVKIAVKH